jgi:hypothetical protein
MAKKKRSRLSLYELMGGAPREAVEVDEDDVVVETARVEEEPEETWLSPGRALVLPVGYLLLAGALALVLVVMAYIIGYDRGDATARRELAEGGWPVGDMQAGGWPGGQDPLTVTDQPGGGVLGSPEPTVAPPNPQPADPSGEVPIEFDPRVAGYNYFILVETTRDGALRLAEFCRSHGLETYVVAGKNSRRRVIALPGYDVSRTDPEVLALERRIHDVGNLWKQLENGRTNLHDAYPERFRP